MTARTSYRLALAATVTTALFLAFGIGALGIIGSGGPADLMYVAALAVVGVGAVVTRGRAHGMAVSLAAAALVTMFVGIVAVAAGLGDREGVSDLEIFGLSGMYAALFGFAAWLFEQS